MENKEDGMRKVLLLSVLLSLVIAGQAEALTIEPFADAFVISWIPTYNNGSNGVVISAGQTSSGTIRSFLKFDLASSPDIGSAMLWLYNNAAPASGSSTMSIYSTTNSWTETGVNWNNQPPVSGSPINTFITTAGWFSWDVTSLAQTANGGDFSLSLRGASGSALSFASAESSPVNHRPYLSLEAPPEPVVPEPASLSLVSMGLAAFFKRRRQRIIA